MQEISRIAVMAALGGALIGCAPPPPPSPEQERLEHQYQMGCRPEDAQGYERAMPYCSHGDTPN